MSQFLIFQQILPGLSEAVESPAEEMGALPTTFTPRGLCCLVCCGRPEEIGRHSGQLTLVANWEGTAANSGHFTKIPTRLSSLWWNKATWTNMAMASRALCHVLDLRGSVQPFAESNADGLFPNNVPFRAEAGNVLARQQTGPRKTEKGYLASIRAEYWT